MPRSLLVLALLVTTLAPAVAKEKEKDARAHARLALDKYLVTRFRGADFKEYAPLVTWSADEEPACSTLVRSYEVSEVRIKDKDTALATVVFVALGSYCPAGDEFQPAPHIETVVFQLRHRSIFWQIEKSNRPGGQVDWRVVRDQLQQRATGAGLAADKARAADALRSLEWAGGAIGRTNGSRR
ncbi:MAG TPA: hypothetical protein VL382_00235 [Terriglobales bacterium]|nr:hypothetical protein [Terriglobales bacterium]